MAMSMSDKEDFKSNIVIRDKEGLYILIKILMHQKDKTTVDIATRKQNLQDPHFSI